MKTFFHCLVSEKKGKTEMPAEASGGIPTKIILTGEKSKSTHKEELTHSKAEEVVKKKIEHAAAFQQKRSSASPSKKYPVSGSLPKLPHSEVKVTFFARLNSFVCYGVFGGLQK